MQQSGVLPVGPGQDVMYECEEASLQGHGAAVKKDCSIYLAVTLITSADAGDLQTQPPDQQLMGRDAWRRGTRGQFSLWRPSRARARVTASANSSSPPMGKP